jgi:hypothetical protein
VGEDEDENIEIKPRNKKHRRNKHEVSEWNAEAGSPLESWEMEVYQKQIISVIKKHKH